MADGALIWQEKSKHVFFEKQNQKTLNSALAARSGHGLPMTSCGETKVFCFFSSEKKTFLQFPSPSSDTCAAAMRHPSGSRTQLWLCRPEATAPSR